MRHFAARHFAARHLGLGGAGIETPLTPALRHFAAHHFRARHLKLTGALGAGPVIPPTPIPPTVILGGDDDELYLSSMAPALRARKHRIKTQNRAVVAMVTALIASGAFS